jgi:hypothetical protein
MKVVILLDMSSDEVQWAFGCLPYDQAESLPLFLMHLEMPLGQPLPLFRVLL